VFILCQRYALKSGTYTYISTIKQSSSGEIICSLAAQESRCFTEEEDLTAISKHLTTEMYLVHIHELISLYQINKDRCTHMFLNHHLINTSNSNMFHLLKCIFQGW
jgi:hypothetical protein